MIRKTVQAWMPICALAFTSGLTLAQTNNTSFQDVLPTGPDAPFYTVIQTAQRLGLAVPSSLGPCLANSPSGTNPPIVSPPSSGSVSNQPPLCPYFGPEAAITRAEAAYWVVRSLLDETQISAFLCATGGDPSGLSPCGGSTASSSTFGDVGVAGASILNPLVGVTNAQLMRYIEVMARRGYTKGCSGTVDTELLYCPNDPINRAQLAVFLVRAKMNNVFPTSLSGSSTTTPFGDTFSYPTVPYFTDVTPTDPQWGYFFPYVQELRALGITNGTSATTYSPGLDVTREQMAAFAVRAFFL